MTWFPKLLFQVLKSDQEGSKQEETIGAIEKDIKEKIINVGQKGIKEEKMSGLNHKNNQEEKVIGLIQLVILNVLLSLMSYLIFVF